MSTASSRRRVGDSVRSETAHGQASVLIAQLRLRCMRLPASESRGHEGPDGLAQGGGHIRYSGLIYQI
jgi:hypothetical protein